ncbi:MAG: TetR/AcrR family transcriptional regulator [Rhodoglobus sp.]
MPIAPARPRRRAARTAPADRRRQLLDTAEEILASGGTDALRMDARARATGVTRPVVYAHFGERDELIVALLARHAARVREHVRAATSIDQDFAIVLRSATRAYLEVATEAGVTMRALTTAEHLSPAIEAERRSYWGQATEMWALRYRRYAHIERRDARALAAAHLAALSTLAGLCAAGSLSVARGTELHTTTTIAALDALRDNKGDPR